MDEDLIGRNGPVYRINKFKESQEFISYFNKFIKEKFNSNKINSIHNEASPDKKLVHGTDQATIIHKEIYKDFDKEYDSYLIYFYRKLAFATIEYLRDLYNISKWAVQRYPSLRIQFPENISVFEFHRDSDYNHPLGEINHFLAITDCNESSALHIEKNLGWDNFSPLNLMAGESAILNTSIYKHGDISNKTDFTRFSIDFRSIPLQVLEKQESKNTVTAQRKLDINDYFMNADEIKLAL